jgi:peptidyl-prolyl cis-trans isomerase D
MLSSIRKFSSSIYAKIVLLIVAIPFIFWGMGDLFFTGNKNTIVKIDNNKISTQEFINFIQNSNQVLDGLSKEVIQSLLYSFIGQKLIEKEIKYYNINLSDKSLSLIIKNNKKFIKDNNFSRTEYEKFLLNNNINASMYESYISKEEKRKQLFDFIGGGVIPTNFMIENVYNKIKQERSIDLIDLNKIYEKNLSITKKEMNDYYDKNKNLFKYSYKTINFIKLNPSNLIGKDEYSDLFFEKIDEIDDLIVEGKDIEFLIKQYNLPAPLEETFNQNGNEIKSLNKSISYKKLIKKFSVVNESVPTLMTEFENEYYIVGLVKVEIIEKKNTDIFVKNKITEELKKIKKRKKISKIIGQINNNNFNKDDFYTFSKKENAPIKNIYLKNLNDESNLIAELVSQIYSAPENKVIIVSDLFLSNAFLVYVKEVKNKNIKKDAKDYKKFFNLSKTELLSSMYNSYDIYLKNKYKIDINYKALDQIDNYFR